MQAEDIPEDAVADCGEGGLTLVDRRDIGERLSIPLGYLLHDLSGKGGDWNRTKQFLAQVVLGFSSRKGGGE
ncbi:hypothetical protein Pme01_49520 [Planosporangium mesophilum]|uniref:Uncharacterized protein n=1 Tax=Planosporangium mesophilum TaxID=689768 RepID=A0A8J3X2E0_9ACTN|nr:hypothetical protein Pme01_49520 [Planosporangium mesophilum]